ncbi:MAG: GNAT family N-acetyltransferase [Clostridia bacterium]|nr:GNAT family N-acetyltransferase [Clostridia bacterium]
MMIKDVSFTLRDGRQALLRSPREEDIQGVLDYLRISAGETEFILRYPEECDRYTWENEKELFEKNNAAPDRAMIVCIVDGRVAGNCIIAFGSNLKTRHQGSVAIALIKEFWGLGIGTRMFEEMIRIAEENPYALQLKLEFVDGNTRARALYEKMGFRITGINPDAIRLKNGTLLNEYIMHRKLSR